jgi:hypothetical protein
MTKCRLIAKLSEFYTTKIVDSLIYLCKRDNHHDHVDAYVVVVGTADVDDDSVALYLGYYDWSISRQLYVLDLWIVHLL